MLRPTMYDFLLQRATLLLPSDAFYCQWIAFRSRQKENPKAALLVSLDYLNFKKRNNGTSEMYEQGLDSLAQLYPEPACQAEIDLRRMNYYEIGAISIFDAGKTGFGTYRIIQPCHGMLGEVSGFARSEWLFQY